MFIFELVYNFFFAAEFGDHEQDKFTAENFKDYPLLPKVSNHVQNVPVSFFHPVLVTVYYSGSCCRKGNVICEVALC